MIAPSDIPGADETLKALFTRFRAAPGSEAFEELAEALLARGHANEALQISEHGLQRLPTHVGGRIQRAAALLALGRPRVAYVELLRAVALEPTNAKALRLLGKVYVEAGAPDRAAKLLAQRHQAATQARQKEAPPPPIPAAPVPADEELDETRRIEIPEDLGARLTPPLSPRSSEAPTLAPALSAPPAPTDVADLFAELTKDLGLKPERSVSTKVEVTQVIRLKQQPRPRPHLSTIHGPIVDTTQPGDLEIDSSGPLEPIETTKTPASLFEVVTSPHGLGGMSLSDVPLFQEDLPFRLEGVKDVPESSSEPQELDFDRLRRSMTKEVHRLAPEDDDERGVLGTADLPASPAEAEAPPAARRSRPPPAHRAASGHPAPSEPPGRRSATTALVALLLVTAAGIALVLVFLR